MAKCLNCDRKGFFLSTDSRGLCNRCSPGVSVEIVRRRQVIQESLDLALRSKSLATQLTRCSTVIDHAEALAAYEAKGITTGEPAGVDLMDMARRLRDDLLRAEILDLAEKSSAKAQAATTQRGEESALASGLVKMQEMASEMTDPAPVHDAILARLTEIHRAKLDGFLEEARKAEFKGNTKKAIDQYQEALFFVLNDDIPDEDQAREIASIRKKIADLGGAVTE